MSGATSCTTTSAWRSSSHRDGVDPTHIPEGLVVSIGAFCEKIGGLVRAGHSDPELLWNSESAGMSAGRSVSRVLSRCVLQRNDDGHPSGAAGCPTALAADPRAGQRTSPPWLPTGCALLFGLAPGGVCPFHSVERLAPIGGIVTVALVLALRRAGVTRHPALGSSDFPHVMTGRPVADARPSDRLADCPSLPRGSEIGACRRCRRLYSSNAIEAHARGLRDRLLEIQADVDETIRSIDAAGSQPRVPPAKPAGRITGRRRPVREVVLEYLEDLGWPANGRELAMYASARYGRELPSVRFGSLGADERTAYVKGAVRPVWLCHALSHDRGEVVQPRPSGEEGHTSPHQGHADPGKVA